MLEAELTFPAETKPAELMVDSEDDPAVVAVGVTREFPRSGIGGRGSDRDVWKARWLWAFPGRAVRSFGSCSDDVLVLT